MMLFKLSLKNIKKSFKDYTIYFFTLVLGVAIFYVFNAIDSQTIYMDVTSNMAEIIKLMTSMLSGVSVFVSFVLGFLIIYANRFLIKRRNKEFGVYLTLGMSKKKISLLLFFETLFVGLISLVVGLGVGVMLSQAMSLLVANLFEANMTDFAFVFSTSACEKTLLYFGIMYLLVMIFNTINISKCKLIELLQSNKKTEKIRLKNPVLCTIIFILSTFTLGTAYYLVTGGIDHLDNANKIFIPIAMGIISTFFIFWSLSGLLLKACMSIKGLYYKGLNSFTLRQISSKINTTVFSMTVICLMLFVTVCVLSSALSIKNAMTANIRELAPVDVSFSKYLYHENSVFDVNTPQAVLDDAKVSLKETLKNHGIDINETFKDVVEIPVYRIEELTMRATLGEQLDEISKKFKYLNYDNEETIITVSDYNKIAKLYGNETYSLNDDEYMIIADFDSMVEIRNMALNEGVSITINDKTYHPKYTECKDGFVEISSNHINDGIFIVPDHAVEGQIPFHELMVANFKETSREGKNRVNDMINKKINSAWNETTLTSVNTKIEITDASVGLGGLVTFIGLYLGIIFLISSAAILALKELSESTDNKERFQMLRRLGADEKMIHKALFSQIAIFFMAPLILAIIHSIFGIKFCIFILETFGRKGLLSSIIMTSIFLVLIYGGYFILTYICSKNIIEEN